MKNVTLLLTLWAGLFWLNSLCPNTAVAQEKLPVEERMAKARAAKAQKKIDRTSGALDPARTRPQKATPADYQAPVDKVRKGPNGEVVHTGERGAKFYINKNGNKTYLSSNQ